MFKHSLLSFFTLTLLFILTNALSADPSQCTCFRTSQSDIFTNHKRLYLTGDKAKESSDTFFRGLTAPSYGGTGTTNPNTMSASNVNFTKDYLELKTWNVGGKQHSTGLESIPANILYGSFRARFSVTGSPGGVAGFFTFKEGGKDECDIEILTDEAHNTIRYANHGGDHPNIAYNGTYDWTQFLTHRFDWTSKASTFWVNGKKVHEMNTGMPTQPSTLSLNMWSSGPGWGGNMAPGGEARMRIKWIDAFYNVSGETGAPKGKKAVDQYGGQNAQPGAGLAGCKVLCDVVESSKT